MLLPTDRNTKRVILLAAMAACAPLIFRYFASLDGPVHVFQAAVLEQDWTTPRYVAEGIAYRTDRIEVRTGDLLLMALLHVFAPETCHALFAAVVLFLLPVAVLAVVNAFGANTGWSALWSIPIAFGSMLVLGFLHFLLGTALALLAAAYWLHQERIAWRRSIVFAAALVLLYLTHRSAPLVCMSVAVCGELGHCMASPAARRARWVAVPRKLRVPGIAVLFACAAVPVLHTFLRGAQVVRAWRPEAGHQLAHLRPLLLLDREGEGGMLAASGVLLVLTTLLLLAHRVRMRAVQAGDALLVLALICWAASVLFEGPRTALFYWVERAQWLGLLFLAAWFGTSEKAPGVVATACCAMLVHVPRLVHAEHGMFQLKAGHDRMLEAAATLGEGSAVVPYLCDGNWLAAHEGAFAAIRHNGIFFTRKEHLHFAFADPPVPAVRRYLTRMSWDRTWLTAHLASRRRPAIAHLLIIGGDPHLRSAFLEPIAPTLAQRYWRSFDNGYATVYTLEPERAGGE